jgi:hypothetical protein
LEDAKMVDLPTPEIAKKIAAFGNDAKPATISYDLPVADRYVGRRVMALSDWISDDQWLKGAKTAGVDVSPNSGWLTAVTGGKYQFDVIRALWLFRDELEAEGGSPGDIDAIDATIGSLSTMPNTTVLTDGAMAALNLLPSGGSGPGASTGSYADVPEWGPGGVQGGGDPGPETPDPDRFAPAGAGTLSSSPNMLPGVPHGTLRNVRLFLLGLSRGELLLPRRRWSGEIRLMRIPIPLTPADEPGPLQEIGFPQTFPGVRPMLFVIEVYAVTARPAGFGLGKPVRFFPFLPGESLTLPLIAWRPTDAITATTILDSFCPWSAETYCNELLAQTGYSMSRDLSSQFAHEIIRSAGFSPIVFASDGGNDVQVDLGRMDYVRSLSDSLHEHVARASELRSTVEDMERTPSGSVLAFAQASNVNLRRVMGAVYRQLNRRYQCTYSLVDVRVGFSNGRLRSWREAPLWRLHDLLSDLVDPDVAAHLTNDIVTVYKSIAKENGDAVDVAEDIDEGGERGLPFVRVRPHVRQKGIVLHEEDVALTTGSALAEVVMGEADALDRYALALQASDAEARLLGNSLQRVEVDALKAIVDPKERADAYAEAYRPDGNVKLEVQQVP